MTHTYLIASSVGGSILSIFREQEGEQARFSLWNRTIDPNRVVTVMLGFHRSVSFLNGDVVGLDGPESFVKPIFGRGSAIVGARVTMDRPISRVSVGSFDEFTIDEPPAPSKPAPAPKAKPAAKAKPAKPKRDTRKPLTDKQREIVDSLKEYQDLHGFSPTYAELQERLGYKYPANIQQHVRMLKKKGYVSANHGKHRSLSLVNA